MYLLLQFLAMSPPNFLLINQICSISKIFIQFIPTFTVTKKKLETGRLTSNNLNKFYGNKYRKFNESDTMELPKMDTFYSKNKKRNPQLYI